MGVAVETAERFVQVPGGAVYVKGWKPTSAGSGAPLVLLHDSLGCVEMWRAFPGELAQRLGRNVVAYDRLGFGRSAARAALPSVHFVSEEAETCLPAVLAALGLKKVVLFGHSVGGSMAVVSAGRLAEACEAVVTESAQAFVEEHTRENIRRAQAVFAAVGSLERLRKYHGDKAPWVLNAWTEVWLSPQFAGWNLQAELPQVHCPLLAIHGERDQYGSRRFPEMLCKLAGGRAEQLLIPDCGHIPHREARHTVLEAVARFLQDS